MDKKKPAPQIAVLIPAAGSSTRMGAEKNKQFLKIGGVPVLAHTILVFHAMPEIDRIVVILNPDEYQLFQDEIAEPFELTDVEIVAGGSDRQESVINGLRSLEDMDETSILLVHDGARPLVTKEIIRANIHAVLENGAAVAAVPAANTVKVTDSEGFSIHTPDRNTLYEAQTPQGFRIGLYRDAVEQAEREGFSGTDDVSLVERAGLPVKISPGSRSNLKITVPSDLKIAEALSGTGKTKH